MLATQAKLTRNAMRDCDLEGHDPYDGLTSPLFNLPLLRTSWLPRFASQQLVLRSPVDLRGPMRIPRQLNAVTVALYVQGLADLAESGRLTKDEVASEISRWVEKLETLASPTYSGPCWGYPFPWEGRRHRMPADTPTVVATSMVVNALHSVWQSFGNETARQMVIASSKFVLDDLPRAEGPEGTFCWSYSPVDHQKVLNATLKGSRILIQAIEAGMDVSEVAGCESAAIDSARFVALHQEEDGGWPYAADGDPRTWRDHHHTGYVLECLDTVSIWTRDPLLSGSVQKGWIHYRSNFFDHDNLPLYYDDRDGPLDATAAGQAMITLARFGDAKFGVDVAEACLSILARPDGTFVYRRNGKRLSRTHFIRWSTAWMFAGMARLLRTEAEFA